MDHVFHAAARPASKGRFEYLGCLLRRLHRVMVEPWRRRAAIGELQRLGQRALRDAGIEPYDIEAVVDDMLARNRQDE
jgi:uncharacterized protein YjiS (DUF1127 family)